MTTQYADHVAASSTPQSEPILGRESEMKKNRAGGFTFTLDKWAQLERFLVLGAEGGTYYAAERELTRENASVIVACGMADPARAAGTILRFWQEDRCPKMQPLLFALAVLSTMAGPKGAAAANLVMPDVCGIATHLFTYLKFRKALGGGWGRGHRRAVSQWYNEKTPEKLAYQVVKYRQREGWTHRDVLRLAHPKAATDEHNYIYRHTCGKGGPIAGGRPGEELLQASHFAAQATKPSDILPLIREHNLPWECIPTDLMKSPEVNEALLEKMPMTATIRQLGRLSAVGLLKPMSNSAKLVIERLTQDGAVKQARVHPIQVLSALCTYRGGHGARGSLSWDANQAIVDALDEAFYAAFGNITPTGQRTYIGLDVSGSMTCGDIAGVPGLTPRNASAAMAMVTARAEAPGSYHIAGFTGRMQPLDITQRDRLDSTIGKVAGLTFGPTDCALPMLDAIELQLEVDIFLCLTDNETWYGGVHPVQALADYRQKMGIDAKLIVCGMTATEFTIADPRDNRSLDVVGFDSATPQIISDFAAGRI